MLDFNAFPTSKFQLATTTDRATSSGDAAADIKWLGRAALSTELYVEKHLTLPTGRGSPLPQFNH